MADNGSSGGIGVLGVLVGALIVVIVVGGGLLFATGKIGGKDTATLKIEMPKVTTGSTAKVIGLIVFETVAARKGGVFVSVQYVLFSLR